jgi:hypothetical protein
MPNLLVGLALPYTRSRSLLSRRGIGAAFVILGVDVLVLFFRTVWTTCRTAPPSAGRLPGPTETAKV